MFAFNKLVLAAAAIAGLQLAGTSAASFSISSQCQTTLATIVASPDATCLNAQSLVGLVVSSTSSSSASVVPSIDTWLKGLCGKAPCSNDTLSAVVQNVTSGCSTELSSLGLSNVDSGELTSLVQTAYPTVRQVACLADTTNGNALCVTETLDNIEPYTGNLTVSNIASIASSIMAGSIPTIPSNVTCTDCTKAQYNLVSQTFGDLIPSSVISDVASTCGASFTDGAQPSTVTQLASDSSSSETVTPNGAASSFSMAPIAGLAASSLIAITTAFALLA